MEIAQFGEFIIDKDKVNEELVRINNNIELRTLELNELQLRKTELTQILSQLE